MCMHVRTLCMIRLQQPVRDKQLMEKGENISEKNKRYWNSREYSRHFHALSLVHRRKEREFSPVSPVTHVSSHSTANYCLHHMLLWYSQWTVNLMEAVNGLSSVAVLLAWHRYSAPLSASFVTIANSDETIFPFVVTVAPVLISSSRTNHLSVGIGFPPLTTHVRRWSVPALIAVFSWYPKIEGGSGGSVCRPEKRGTRNKKDAVREEIMQLMMAHSSVPNLPETALCSWELFVVSLRRNTVSRNGTESVLTEDT